MRTHRFCITALTTTALCCAALGAAHARGEWEIELADDWDEGVDYRGTVTAPLGAGDWGDFLRGYFREPGDRSVELRSGNLTMAGDATVGLRQDWLAEASDVVDKERVEENFTLHPSVYHFPAYSVSRIRTRRWRSGHRGVGNSSEDAADGGIEA